MADRRRERREMAIWRGSGLRRMAAMSLGEDARRGTAQATDFRRSAIRRALRSGQFAMR
jgi:hypothetical protein